MSTALHRPFPLIAVRAVPIIPVAGHIGSSFLTPSRKERAMRAKRLAFIGILLLLAVGLASAQTLEEKVEEFELDNGMEFVVVKRDVAPVFFAAVLFDVGSINETSGLTGISHFLEHMMFKGTKTVGTKDWRKEKKYLEQEDEIAEEIYVLRDRITPWRFEIYEDFARDYLAGMDEEAREEMGSDRAGELRSVIGMLEARNQLPEEAERYPGLIEEGGTDYYGLYLELKRLELDLEETLVEHRELIIKDELWDTYIQNGARMLNAFTANDLTGYIVYLPANRLELWMMLESDRLQNPTFREFYSEKNVVCEERRLGENDPESELWDAFMAAAFQASPYGRPVIGWMCDIQATTRPDMIEYFKRYYAPNNATALLVGDLDVREVEKLAKRYFGRIPSQEPVPPVRDVEPEQKGERRVSVEFDANPQVMIGYHVPVAPHPDAYAVEALASILGTGRTSRLYKTVYEEMELTSSPPSVAAQPGAKLSNLLVIDATPRHPHTTEEVEEAIYREIEKLKEEPPTRREVQRLRNQVDARMVRTLGSNLGIAFSVGFSIAARGDWRAYLEDMEKLKEVEPEDISYVARKYLTSTNRTVATLVEKEAPEGEETPRGPEGIDMRALMAWIRTLPEEEQKEIYMRVQTMSEAERMEFGKELMKRMKAESDQEDSDE
jgi:predicted Zn-dependent peptidase